MKKNKDIRFLPDFEKFLDEPAGWQSPPLRRRMMIFQLILTPAGRDIRLARPAFFEKQQ